MNYFLAILVFVSAIVLGGAVIGPAIGGLLGVLVAGSIGCAGGYLSAVIWHEG